MMLSTTVFGDPTQDVCCGLLQRTAHVSHELHYKVHLIMQPIVGNIRAGLPYRCQAERVVNSWWFLADELPYTARITVH